MKNRSASSIFVPISLSVWFLLSVSCSRHPFDNIVDPDGDYYQGFRTVDGLNEIMPEGPAQASIHYLFPELLWSRSTSAAAYHLQISSSASFGTLVFENDALATNRFTLKAADLTGGPYADIDGQSFFWRVRAKGSSGTWGAWSAESFQVVTKGPDGLKPSDKAQTSTGVLDWNDVTGAASYEIQIASSDAGLKTSARQTVTASTYTVPVSAMLLGETRYWRVRPIGKNGEVGFWSSSRSFMYYPAK